MRIAQLISMAFLLGACIFNAMTIAGLQRTINSQQRFNEYVISTTRSQLDINHELGKRVGFDLPVPPK